MFLLSFCALGLLFRMPSVNFLFLVLPAGHFLPSVWCKSSPDHLEPARVQSSDGPGTRSQYHSEMQTQDNQMQGSNTRVSVYVLFFFFKWNGEQMLINTKEMNSPACLISWSISEWQKSLPLLSANVYTELSNSGWQMKGHWIGFSLDQLSRPATGDEHLLYHTNSA